MFTGQSSSGAKLKTLTGALDILTDTRHAFLLIHKELLEDHTEVQTQTEIEPTAFAKELPFCLTVIGYI